MTQSSPLGTPMPWELVATPYVDDVMPMLEKWKRADEGARAALDKALGGKAALTMTVLLSVGTRA